MEPIIIREKISKEELKKLVDAYGGDMIKVDVDVERKVVTIGGDWHSEGDELLVQDGSNHEEVWGINLFPYAKTEARIEYSSLINLKPRLHTSIVIADPELKKRIHAIVMDLILADTETI